MNEAQSEYGPLFSQECLNLPLSWHNEFDSSWLKTHSASFHNKDHITAVERANTTYLERSNENNDPLNLRRDLKEWNKQNPDSQFTYDELKELMVLVARYHDTGNIISKLVVENGQLKPIYLPNYQAQGAEERSQEIIEVVIRNLNLPEDKKEKYLKLAKHLINETKFNPDNKESPFAVSMRFFDQIGNGLFNENPNMIEGLIEELISENPNAQINPYFFYNFTRLRPAQLGITDETMKTILEILDKTLPEEKQLPNEPVLASEFLSSLNARKT
ncbi:MAG: hypothetical protein ACK4FL_01530 [Microgenomates group bacterium]